MHYWVSIISLQCDDYICVACFAISAKSVRRADGLFVVCWTWTSGDLNIRTPTTLPCHCLLLSASAFFLHQSLLSDGLLFSLLKHIRNISPFHLFLVLKKIVIEQHQRGRGEIFDSFFVEAVIFFSQGSFPLCNFGAFFSHYCALFHKRGKAWNVICKNCP